MARLLDGKKLATQLQAEVAQEASAFIAATGVRPCLAAVLVGENPASEVYVRNKHLACERVGIAGRLLRLSQDAPPEELSALVASLNADPAVHGILVQLPLPPQHDSAAVLQAIDPLKDVDGFHAENVGRLVQGRPRFIPCTPYGVQQLLVRNGIETRGRRAVVVGRSDIVGKPMAALLLARGPGGDATVTVCHSQTDDLPEVCRSGEILVVAIGKARFVTREMVRPGATVIDVGMNRVDGKLCGDVDFEGVSEVAGAITPVPGGVGPLTVTMLLFNTLAAAKLQTGRG